jgi:protein SCO1/2
MRKIFLVLPIIFLAVGVFYLSEPKTDKIEDRDYDFNLITADGNITLDSFKDKVVVVYFGYMSCPDVCPTSLSLISDALKSFDKEQLSKIAPLFISVDGDRDTPLNLKKYVEYFNPIFTGSTANTKEIDRVVNNYGSYYKNVYLKDSKLGYSVTHTSYVYVIKNKKLIAKLRHLKSPSTISNAIKVAL